MRRQKWHTYVEWGNKSGQAASDDTGNGPVKNKECSWNAVGMQKSCLPVGPYQNCSELPSQGWLVWSRNRVVVVESHHQCCILPPRPLCWFYKLSGSNYAPGLQQLDVLLPPLEPIAVFKYRHVTILFKSWLWHSAMYCLLYMVRFCNFYLVPIAY